MQRNNGVMNVPMNVSIVVRLNMRPDVKETKYGAAQRGNKLIEFHGSKLVAGAVMGPERPV